MFFEYNYFRQYNDNKEIDNYKEFYKRFSNEREFGGEFTHLDHWVQNRFLHVFGYMFDIVLRSRPANILDIGCGNGQNLPLSLIFKEIKYTGIDYAENTLRKAKEIYPQATFKLMDGFELDFPDKTFALVIMSLLLTIYNKEEDQLRLLREAGRVMKDDGVFVLVVLNENFFVKNSIRLSRLLARFQNITLPEDFNAVHFSFKDIAALSKKSGLKVEERINTAALYGVSESVKYLKMKKYKRSFGKAEGESGRAHPQNFLKDLQNATGSVLLARAFFYIAKLFPNLFSLITIYVLAKDGLPKRREDLV